MSLVIKARALTGVGRSATTMVLVFFGICQCQQLSADIITEYDFQSSTLAPSTVASGVTASDMSQNFSNTQGNRASNWNFRRNTTRGGSTYLGVHVAAVPSPGINTAEYFEFQVSPNANEKLNLTKLDITASNESFSGGVRRYWVRSDIAGDNFTTNLANLNTGARNPAFAQNNFLTPFEVDLGGAEFQNVSSPLTFRIYMADDSQNLDTARWSGIDNVRINGTFAAIPEPSSLSLLAVAASGGMCLRRRKR